MLPSLGRHPDKDIRTGGAADAATNWGEEVAGGEGGEFIFRTRVLVSKSKRDRSDPRVAELSTPKKKICQRNMSDIFRKKICWELGRTYFETYFSIAGKNQFTQMIARQYKKYIRQFRR
jgi:hypothetical protein